MATWECPREWSEWTDWLGAGLHGRCRWRLPIVLFGILFAREPQTVARLSSGERLLLALDDTPTKRYGPKVQGAGIHHNPTSGPADAKYL